MIQCIIFSVCLASGLQDSCPTNPKGFPVGEMGKLTG